MSSTILIVDDDKPQRVATKTTILATCKTVGEHYNIEEAASVEEALDYFEKAGALPCLVIVDMLLPRKRSGPDPEFCEYAGYELLRCITAEHPEVWWLVASAQRQLNQIIVEDEGRALLAAVTGYSNVIGIWFKTKEADLEQVLEQFLAFESQSRSRKGLGQRAQSGSVRELLDGEIFIATSSVSLNLYSKALMLAMGPPSPVLAIGERGAGKELISRLLHKLVNERLGVKTAGYQKLSGGSVEYNELFGLLAEIGEGTLYIEDLDKMPKSLQDDLARNLAELKNYSARVVYGVERHHSAFTPTLVSDDVYLTSFILPIPSLRDRQDEIIELSRVFLQLYNAQVKTSKRLVQEHQVDQALQACQWRNNLDDLRLLIEQAASMTASPAVGLAPIEEAARQRKLLQ